MVIDVFRAIVGMEAQNAEREVGEQDFQRGEQIGLADLLDAGDDLPLGDLIDGIDVIEALVTVPIALMDRVDAQVTGAAVGLGFAPLADRYAGRSGLGQGLALRAVRGVLAQVVEVADGDPGQARVRGMPEDPVLALQNLLGGRPTQRAVQRVGVGQQAHILGGVLASEAVAARPLTPHAPTHALAGDQARELGTGVTGELLQIAAQQAFVGFAQAGVGEAHQGLLDPGVALGGGRKGKLHRCGAGQEGPDLLQGVQCGVIHDGVHPPS